MPTDALTGSRYPASSNVPNVPQDIQNAVFDLSDNTIPYFTSTTARNTAYSTWVTQGGTMRNGLQCYVNSVGPMIYELGQWRNLTGVMGLLHGSSTQAITSGGSHKAVTLASSQYADGITAVTASGRLTAVFPGRYLVSGAVTYATSGASASGYRVASILKNGTLEPRSQNKTDPDTANSLPVCTATYPIDLAVGDYVQLGTFQNAGVSQDIDRAGCFLQATFIGPL